MGQSVMHEVPGTHAVLAVGPFQSAFASTNATNNADTAPQVPYLGAAAWRIQYVRQALKKSCKGGRDLSWCTFAIRPIDASRKHLLSAATSWPWGP